MDIVWEVTLALMKKTKARKQPAKSIYELDHIIYQKLFRPRKDTSWQQVVYLDPCSYCGAKNQKKPSMDHIIPQRDGGPDKWENIVGACEKCNGNRGRVPLLKYLVSRSHALSGL